VVSELVHFIAPCVTPNHITTVGNVSRFTLIGLLWTKTLNPITSSLLFFLQYFFDGLDGNYARKYNLSTPLGEMYDHYSDQLFTVFLVVTVMLRYTLTPAQIFTAVLSWFLNCLYLAADHGVRYNCDPTAKNSLFFLKYMTCDQLEFLAVRMKYLQLFGPATMNLVVGGVLASVVTQR